MGYVLHRVQWVPTPLAETFDFFSRPQNLARITPPWLAFRMVSDDADMREGLRIEYRIRPFGIPRKWVSGITAYDPPHRFVDEQLRGPYAGWHHEHGFRAADGGTEVTDTVSYALPLGPLGRLAHVLFVRRQLEAIFAFRQEQLDALLGDG